MGAGSSDLLHSSDPISKLYVRYCAIHGHAGSAEGGGSKMRLGNAEGYEYSVMSSAKQQLIRDIASDFAEKLKIPKLNPSNKSLEEIITELKTHVPDPRKGRGNKKTWSDKEKNQVKGCEILAEIINNRTGEEIINSKLKPGQICEQVSETMYGLFESMHAEFTSVHKDIERLLKNISTLTQILERNYNALATEISRDASIDADSTIAVRTNILRTAHKDTMDELKRQEFILQSMLDTIIKPAELDLISTTKDMKEFKALVEKIKQYPGTGKFAEKFSYTISGIRSVASAAKIVDDALKKLGIKFSEYAKATSAKNLRNLLNENMEKHLNQPERELVLYERAMNALYNFQYMHDDIIEELKQHHGKGEEDAHKGGAKLDKRISERQTLLKNLFKSFTNQFSNILNNLLISAQAAAESVGSGSIPLTDALETLPKALDLLPDLEQRSTYYALAGYHSDIRSRETREKVVSTMRNIVHVLNDIIKKDEKDSHLKDMKYGFEALIKLIDEYSNRYTEGFGALPLFKSKKCVTGQHEDEELKADMMEDNIASPTIEEAVRIEEDKHEDEIHHGHGEDDDVFGGGICDADIAGIGYKFSHLKDIINYYFRTARIRVNLDKASNEMCAYGEDYTKILADSIASSVDSLQLQKNEWNTKLIKTDDPLYTALVSDKDKLKGIVEAKCKIFDAKIDMYRIAECVDLYMKSFADNIAAHPDDIRNIIKILNSTEVISKWFTNKSGDLLCQVFDSFPGSFDKDIPRYSNLPDYVNNSKLVNSKIHYYLRVACVCRIGDISLVDTDWPDLINGQTSWSAWETHIKLNKKADEIRSGKSVSLPGNPFLAIPAVDTNGINSQTILNLTCKALSVSMLKNIISAFITIGNIFGEKDISKDMPISKINLYKGLMNYIAYSSFTMGMKEYNKAINNTNNGSLDATEISNLQCIIPNEVSSDDTTLKSSNITRICIGLTGNETIGAKTDAYVSRTSAWAMRGVGKNFGNISPAIDSTAVNSPSKFSGNPFTNDFADTDVLFTLVIKSIVAKILTTIGVYNMFNRPIQSDGLGYFSGLRLTLGGSPEIPKVIPDALELYVRLPLLAEFYRKVFNFEEGIAAHDTSVFKEISMVPEIEGIFAGLISIIFDKAKYVESGMYSEIEIRGIIEEINKIWIKFKDRKNTVSEIIHEFIAEINRRIGIYNKEAREKYIKEKEEKYKDRYVSDVSDASDFILDTIDETDTFFRPTPSMSYQIEGRVSGSANAHKHKLEIENHIKFIRNTRNTIDKMFKNAMPKDVSQNLANIKTIFTFDHMLTARKEELKYAKSEQDKYNIVHSAITSLSQFAMSALEKSLILFHEIVVAPLATLYGLYKMLNTFYIELNKIYIGLHVVKTWSEESAPNRVILSSGGGKPTDLLNANFKEGLAVPVLYKLTGGTIIILQGRQGLNITADNNDITYDELQNILTDNQDTPKINELLYRFCVDQGKVLNKSIELLYGHATDLDNLIDFKFDVVKKLDNTNCGVSISLDYSKLYKYITNTLANIKNNIDKFRGLLPKNIIDKYETYNTDKPGALYWLEKNLVDTLLEGKHMNKLNNYLPANDNLNNSTEKLKYIFDYLTTHWEFNARGLFDLAKAGTGKNNLNTHLTAGGSPLGWRTVLDISDDGKYAKPVGALPKKTSQHEFDTEIYKLIFYNPFDKFESDFPPTIKEISNLDDKSADFGTKSKEVFDYIPVGTLLAILQPAGSIHTGIEKILFNSTGSTVEATKDGFAWNKTLYWYNKYIYNPDVGFTFDARSSVWLLFNRLIAAYLTQMYDEASHKIYSTTINAFASGAFSHAVIGHKTYSDNAIALTNNIISDNPTYSGVLLSSLATIMNRFITEKLPKMDKLRYLESDLVEIPMYLKERMREDLPVYGKLFNYMIKRCELLKTLTRTLNIAQPVDGVRFVKPHAPANLAKIIKGLTTPATANQISPTKHKTRYENEGNMLSILNEIIMGSSALIKCTLDTYSELADHPKVLELHQGFIQEYESLNSKIPFMPLSSVLYYIQGSLGIKTDAYPIHKMGTDAFKLLYGTRGVLNQQEKIEDIPGFLDIIKQHNESTEKRHHIDVKDISKYNNEYISIARYLTDGKRYKLLFSFYDVSGLDADISAKEAYSMMNIDLFAGTDIQKQLPFSLRDSNNLSDVVRLTESSSQMEQKRKIITILEESDNCPMNRDRNSMIIYNIIDLNIVPVNIYALRREIPLIHLYNYSWTFDKLINQLFNLGDMDELPISNNEFDESNTHSSKLLLGKLMIDPYADVNQKLFNFYIAQIIRGNIGIEGFGRPKYLADEIYNKALFGELYPGELYEEEGGPGSGDAHLHGKLEVLFDGNGTYYYAMLAWWTFIVAYFCIKDDNFTNGGGYNVTPISTDISTTLTNIYDFIKDNAVKLLFDISNLITLKPLHKVNYADVRAKLILLITKSNLISINVTPTKTKTAVTDSGTASTAATKAVATAVTAVAAVTTAVAETKAAEEAVNNAFKLITKAVNDITTADSAPTNKNIVTAFESIEAAKGATDDAVVATDNAKAVTDAAGGVAAVNSLKTDVDATKTAVDKALASFTIVYNGMNVDNTNADAVATMIIISGIYFTLQYVRSKIVKEFGDLSSFNPGSTDAAKRTALIYNVLTGKNNYIVYYIGRDIYTNFQPQKAVDKLFNPAVNVSLDAKASAPPETGMIFHELRHIGDFIGEDPLVKKRPPSFDVNGILQINLAAAEPYAHGSVVGTNIVKANIRQLDSSTPIIKDTAALKHFGTFIDIAFKNNRPKSMDRANNDILAIENNNDRYFPNKLHFLAIDDREETKIKSVNVGSYKSLLQVWGKLRFDTVLIRTLFWLTNIQRILRLKLRRDLTWFDQKVVNKYAITASGITESFGNDLNPNNFPDEYRY